MSQFHRTSSKLELGTKVRTIRVQDSRTHTVTSRRSFLVVRNVRRWTWGLRLLVRGSSRTGKEKSRM